MQIKRQGKASPLSLGQVSVVQRSAARLDPAKQTWIRRYGEHGARYGAWSILCWMRISFPSFLLWGPNLLLEHAGCWMLHAAYR